jgi:hypothetical protein
MRSSAWAIFSGLGDSSLYPCRRVPVCRGSHGRRFTSGRQGPATEVSGGSSRRWVRETIRGRALESFYGMGR